MKVVQIGFNRCGTTSLNNFFDKVGLNSIHWDSGNLAKSIEYNVKNGNAPLTDYENYNCFTDLEYVGNDKYIYAFMDYFKEIDEAYEDVKFILNTRDVDAWVQSRLKHGNYLGRFRNITKLNDQGVIKLWKSLWEVHHSQVASYFEGRANFITFDINNDRIEKVCEFLSLDPELKKYWGHFNKR